MPLFKYEENMKKASVPEHIEINILCWQCVEALNGQR